MILQADGPSLAQGANSNQLGLEVFGYAFDAEGQVRDVVTLSPVVDLGAAKARLEGKGLQFITSFAVPSGPVDLRFFVREKSSERTGSLRLRVEMPAPDGDGVVLSPPLAMDDPRSRLVLPAPSRSASAARDPVPARGRSLHRRATADARERRRARGLRDGLGRAHPQDRAQDWSSSRSSSMPRAAARDVPLDVIRLVPDADGVGRYVLTLRPTGIPRRLPPRMSLCDPESGATGSSELAVRVE